MLKIMIIYESMFGETRRIAEAVERGARSVAGPGVAVTLRRVSDAQPEEVWDLDVLVVGAPTHAQALSRPETRAEAAKWASDHSRHLTLEPDALEDGVREFLPTLHPTDADFVAFDTRVDAPELFTGSAARGIRRRLIGKGLEALLPAESFLVTKKGHLLDGEEERAEDLGRAVVEAARVTFPAAGALVG
jgi:hypothetical protein